MKGDKVEIVIDAGGDTRTYEVTATRAGRRVEISQGRGIVEVTEVTRGGTAVRTARFMSARVLALVEHPAPRPAQPGRRRGRPAAPVRLTATAGQRTAGWPMSDGRSGTRARQRIGVGRA